MEPEVQYHIHNGSPIIPILSRIKAIPCIAIYFFKNILILYSHLCVGLPRSLFPIGLPVNILRALLRSLNNNMTYIW